MGICYEPSSKNNKNNNNNNNSSSSSVEKFRANWRSGKIFRYDVSSIDLNDIIIPRFDKLIADKIHFRDRIGSGSFGDVFRSEFEGKMYAVKILNPPNNLSQRAEYIKSLERTIKLCRSLRHRNVLDIVGYSGAPPEDSTGDGGKSKTMGYIMPLMKQSLLDAIIKSKKKEDEKKEDDDTCNWNNNISLQEKINWLEQVSSGMLYLHENHVMHRDLKLENVLLSSDNIIKIIDFDFAKVDESSFRRSYDNSHERLGSLHFMAVEVFQRLNYTKECDIFSFGVMIYCILFEKELPYEYCVKKDIYKLECKNCKIRPTSSSVLDNNDDEDKPKKQENRGVLRMELINHIVKCDLRPEIPKEVEKKLIGKSILDEVSIDNDELFFKDFKEEQEGEEEEEQEKKTKIPSRDIPIFSELVTLMKQCWKTNPKERPKFDRINNILNSFL